ncbi:transglutaminase family protein [Leisingera sp. ANG-M7]|uniref:transglutaminase family protein n=1 Tax=Leisingera sp. ANG-M7 TaxID=1577902 RepID=UPI00187BEBF5|nr:transglutaminase family protein [Leisingera sp. ANG-M7]
MQTADLARVKLEVDRIIDPSIDVEAQLAGINRMAAEVQAMLPHNADAWAKVEVLRRYIYEPGPWNTQRAFAYDHDDPYGRDVRNKLLGDYLQDRRGNCITMPFLFIILGQRLGLEMAPALAPLHVLVKFTDDQGVMHNLEATSGAGRARDQHYRDLLPISDQALANGLYLAPLDAEQSMAVIAAVVLDGLMARGAYREAMAVADVLLENHPQFAYALVKKGTAAYRILEAEFYSKFPRSGDVPEDQRAELIWLQRVNRDAFQKAEALGWKALTR